ncbi:DUF2513 domain-containing protein [Lachnospiraceae bacterium MD308]|nr:DUF2513 domain-containing protein [Lachnospiraceae bacterium MD308]
MQINIDCFKDVLQFCVDNIDYEEDGDSWNTKYVNLIMLYESPKLNYDKKDIMRSVLKLIECGFIKISSKFPDNKPYLERCSIEDVTFRGYQFIESVREPSVWEKTKTIATKVGNHTLYFLESVAHDLAVEAGKEAVAIAMCKNM